MTPRRVLAVFFSATLSVSVFLASTPGPVAAQPGADPAPDPGNADPTPTPIPAPTAAPVAEPQPTAVPTFVPRQQKAPLTAEEIEVLSEIEKDFERLQSLADKHQKRTQLILAREYENRTRKLEKRYAEKIAAAERDRRSRQGDAMALMEKFIGEHPDHKKFTPDVMFRLAEIYLDEANFEFDQEEFAVANPPEGGEAAPDGQIDPLEDDDFDAEAYDGADYVKALAMWKEILVRFPQYRQTDGVLYLLAYYLKQTLRERESLQIALGLVCKNKYKPLDPPTAVPTDEAVRLSLAPETRRSFINPYDGCEQEGTNAAIASDTWVRIVGDIHFNTAGELGQAISAYEKVARDKKSPLYDEALYKLAWSYYRNDDFMKGIDAFDEVIIHTDTMVAQGKNPDDLLRPEALQYLAISFTDPWGSDELPDAQRGYDRAWNYYKDRMTEPHVRDVWVQLGDTFELLEAFDQSVAAYRLALKHWPLHPQAPIVHQKIVNVYQLAGDNNAADEEAAILAQLYAPGSAWYSANETNREAMLAYQTIGERMLRAAAENIHLSAQLMRAEHKSNPTPEGKAKYIAQYKKAAILYRRFIEEHPTSEMVYEFTYRLGEVLYFSEAYTEAIRQHRWVRDHKDLSEGRFQQAALKIVQSYEAELARMVKNGEVTEPPDPKLEDLKAMAKPITPRQVPQIYQDYRAALDEYQKLVNDPSKAPSMGLNAGMISYRFYDLDDAEERFTYTFKNFCGTRQAVQAKDNLLAIYEATNQDDKFSSTNDEFINSKCGTEEEVELARAQIRSKAFRQAEDLFKSKQYDQAAIAFYRYLKQAPADDPNLPIALYNSAVAYDRAGKPKTAVYLFKEFTNNTDKQYRDSAYYLPALYQTANSHYKAFDYKSAVSVFLDVVRIASQTGRVEPAGDRTRVQIRLDALFNAALMRELDRVFRDPRGQKGTGAASLYKRYADAEPDRRKSDRALWAIARIWGQAGDLRSQSKAYTDWRGRYGKDQGNGDDYVFSFYDLAKKYEKKSQSSNASREKTKTISAWQQVGSPSKTPAATMAAEFTFEKADAAKKAFDRYKISRAPRTKKEAENALNKLDSLANAAVARYQDLAKFNSAIWSLAALVRIGDVRFFQGLKIKEIPAPKDLIKLDEKYPDRDILIQYEEALDVRVKPLENQARTQWERVINAGKAQRVSNEWTRLANERLHDFVSQEEFPVIREALSEGTEKP